MGCCGSQPSRDGDSQHPSETTPLIPNDRQPDAVATLSVNSANQSSPDLKAQQPMREKEMLKRIVQRTAEGLIDISSVRLLDRIQQDHANERSNEYRNILTSVEQDLAKSIHSSITNPKILSTSPSVTSAKAIELLRGASISATGGNGGAGSGIIKADQIAFVKDSLLLVKRAVSPSFEEDGFAVRECGSIVVTL
ncbi:hypothetical protein BDR26DRAFT_862335 [Obelidium mucronatum]|nr:hypothetical protein BDR26DRAFT_862335 [Obelidium mucronatum]